MEYCIALSDSLCKELHAFKHGQACDERVVGKRPANPTYPVCSVL
jgi:hypothetical protein